MANGQVHSTQEILKNYTLLLDNHTFLVDLMPMVIRSFDAIIGMDWLFPHHLEVLCFEKALCQPLSNGEVLIVYDDKSSRNLRIICCLKA